MWRFSDSCSAPHLEALYSSNKYAYFFISSIFGATVKPRNFIFNQMFPDAQEEIRLICYMIMFELFRWPVRKSFFWCSRL